MTEPTVSLKEDALIEMRNWANRCQWSAHVLLEEATSDEGRKLAVSDPQAFRSRCHFLLQALQSNCDGPDGEIVNFDVAMVFLQEIGRQRGLHYQHAGCLNEGFAHSSANHVAEWVLDCAGIIESDDVPTAETEMLVVRELSNVIRWNPKELEAQLFAECKYAIEVLNGDNVKTERRGEQQPTKTVRRLNVQKVEGSVRCFKIDHKPIKLSPACANLLNGFTALKESNTPTTPANLMAKLTPRYDSNRKRFEDDKGRFNDALEAVGIAKGFYVVGDVLELCKPPKKTPAKAVQKNGTKTVRRR